MTQNQLENRLLAGGVVAARGYLSRLRYGERGAKSLSAKTLEAIADICGVDFHWLSTGRGQMLPPMTPLILGKTRKPSEELVEDEAKELPPELKKALQVKQDVDELTRSRAPSRTSIRVPNKGGRR